MWIRTLLIFSLCLIPAFAQQNSAAVQLANLTQDVQAMQKEVARMKLTMEQLQRENEQLSKQLKTMIEAQNKLTTSYNAYVQGQEQRLRQLSANLQSADEKQKEAIVAEVSRQIDALAKQTQKAVDQLATAIDRQPADMQPAVEFTSDFPRNGVRYTVERGDTLSGIARKHNSRVSWIQNANKIARPEALQVGETIFIPQEN